MPRPGLKLLAFLLVFSVAPVAASHCSKGHCVGSVPKLQHHSTCVRHGVREKSSASGRVSAPASASAPTTITLTDRVPGDSLFNLGRGGGFLTP